MSNRGTLNVFRGVSRSALRDRLVELAPTLPPFQPIAHYDARFEEQRIDLAESPAVVVAGQPLYSSGVPVLMRTCAASLECPWLILRMEEGDHWDYTLYSGGRHLHDFSTFPQYCGDIAGAEKRRGNPHELADTWGVPLDQVAPYVRNWGEKPNGRLSRRRTLRGKARASDRFPYGDFWQYLDFLHALGAPPLDRQENWESVTIRLPELVFSPRPSP